MARFTFLITLFILLGCQPDKEENISIETLSIKNDSVKIETVKERDSISVKLDTLEAIYKQIEIIDLTKIKINETLTVKNQLKDVIKNLGKPDSIVEYSFENISNWFGEVNTQKYYYKKSSFETNGEIAFLNRIYFADEQFKIQYNDIVFDNNSTIEQFEKLFPKAYKYSTIENLRNGINENFTIRILTKRTENNAWMFEFSNGKLDNVYIWNDNT